MLLKFFGDLTDKRVLDVGCGKGRFARVLKERNPDTEVWGLGISEEMLQFVPAGTHTRAGSMTELPFADSTFDCAYATECLEHAVNVGRAVDENCWVVHPGGKVVIRPVGAWFGRTQMEDLQRHCRNVHSDHLSTGRRPPDGLFLIWFAVR